jgi:hypothetical protein
MKPTSLKTYELHPRTEPQSRSVLPHHDSRLDFAAKRGHEFVTGNLGLTHAIDVGRIAIIHADDKAAVSQAIGETWLDGGYDPMKHEVVVTATPDNDHPQDASRSLVSKVVHEVVHSATTSMSELPEHTFWRETLAGMGEAAYLNHIRSKRQQKVSDYVLERAGVKLWVPAAFRYYDRPASPGANSTQGLIAASAFAITQRASNMGGSRILAASTPRDRSQYKKLRSSFEALKPGLSKEIESFPQTTDGIIQATAVVQDEGRKQGII